MNTEFTRYQKTILRDIQDPHYLQRMKILWRLLGLFALVFVGIYFGFFHSKIGTYIPFLHQMHWASTVSDDPNFKIAIYTYHHLLVFGVFLGAAVFLGVLAFIAFDMHARNSLIQSFVQIERTEETTTSASFAEPVPLPDSS